MDLILLIVVLAIVGAVVWIVTTQIPMPPLWAKALQLLALLVIVLYLLTRFIQLPNLLPR